MKLFFLIVAVLCGVSIYAQQEPHYTQYMYNMSTVNPGYMTNEPGLIKVGSLYRTQWVGIEGAPKTANIFAHIPLNERIELSLNYLNDKIGSNGNLQENVFNIDVAYKIKLKENLNLSFGMKMGLGQLSFDFSNTNLSSDVAFQNTNKTLFNIGAGAFLFKEQFYIGVSSPNLIPTEISNNSETIYTRKQHLFLIGGYVFKMNDNIKLKPSTVIKHVNGAPLTFDFSTNVLLYNKFEIGASYRYQDAVSGLLGFNVTNNLRLGYAYDFNTSELNNFNSGSHEFVLRYTFDVLGLSKKYDSPRFY
jgi:type IX secretion system PorP/SprF family membrane protein